jgi:LL-diaminopimelate aminotransferase
MVERNPNFLKLAGNYLFLEVMQRVKHFKAENPDADLISLSIGDTSEPLPGVASEGLSSQALRMGTRAGYCGYGPQQGDLQLRNQIASLFYHDRITADEIFISDGAKCDIGRLQLLFAPHASIAVQDPTYPVYVETGVLLGSQTLFYLPCLPENGFFPDSAHLPPADLLFICSPNNPTGSVATKEQLKALVEWAKKRGSLLIFDSAYSGFIQDPSLPRTIYEIEGGMDVAIEVSSFSKLIGFTGVRVGWTVLPKRVSYKCGSSVHKDFARLIATFFNGASVISQAGALAALSPRGIADMRQTLSFYLENARLIKEALQLKGLSVYGGENAPYLWVDFGKRDSWDLFQRLLETTGLISTPGSGYGAQGEGFLRFSAFGPRPHILKALERIERRWPANL